MKKETEINIEKLKNQRRLNVEEQNALEKDRILSEAKYWRKTGLPKALIQVFTDKGIDINQCIVLDYKQDFPGICTDEGIILTPERVFYHFEADLNVDRNILIELYKFIDVSYGFEILSNKKGIGKTVGFLAIEVLNELNN